MIILFFLNLIYQNAEMGLIGIDTILKKITDEKLAKLVSEQYKEYEQICQDVKDILINMELKKKKFLRLNKLVAK